MNDDKPISIFENPVSPLVSKQLAAAARWGKFLAFFLMLLIGIYSFTTVAKTIRDTGISTDNMAALLGNITGTLTVALLLFYPVLQLFHFCRLSGKAIREQNPALFHSAFRALHICFKWAVVLLSISLVVSLAMSFIGN